MRSKRELRQEAIELPTEVWDRVAVVIGQLDHLGSLRDAILTGALAAKGCSPGTDGWTYRLDLAKRVLTRTK